MQKDFSKFLSSSSIDEYFLQPLEDIDLSSHYESFLDTDSSPFGQNIDINDSIIFEYIEPAPKICSKFIKSDLNIGSFSQSQRQEKIQKYLEKKRRRTWHKKIHYACRKKVADQRIRYKGRFIKKDQIIPLQN